jgi:formylglycine-generating enzyme required for sulfatase activity
MLRYIRQMGMVFIVMALHMGLVIGACSAAAPTIKLVVNPNATNFSLGSDPVVLTVLARGKNLTFTWKLAGPGTLEGEGSAVFYHFPETIAGPSAQAQITVTVITETGEESSESVTFTILTPPHQAPTPAPSPTLSPTSKPTPIPTMTPALMLTPTPSAIEQLLQEADSLFQRQSFLTPEDRNAYIVYQEVLRRDPANPHAREKLYAMMKVYKSLGDDNYRTTKYSRAKTFYQRYLKIAQYLIESLGDKDIAPEFEDVQKRVQELEAPTPTPAPRLKPQLSPTQPPSLPTPTSPPVAPSPTPTIPLRQPKTWVEPVTGMKFVWVEGGCFNMGSPQNETGRNSGEGPVHEVCVQDFWMGQYEVTQGQWQQIMGENPANFNTNKIGEDTRNYPVEQVSWNDAQKFLREFSKKTGIKTARLPSEAEWEYACRAATSTMYSFGDELDRLAQYAWYKDNSADKTHPVGQLKPNAWGLYDMHGNVWEWSADPGHSDYDGAPPDGSVWEAGGDMSIRMLRGGSWGSHPWGLRSANRPRNSPDYKNNSIGFRVVQRDNL